MGEPLVLRTALGRHDHLRPLRDGRVASDRLRMEFVDFDPLPKAFRRMVREGDLDLSEMAVVSHALAVDHGKPIVALAIPLWSRLPHTNLVCMSNSSVTGPKDLEGTRVGVRAYAQTSGVWVRGLLQTEYGVNLGRITWVTMEDAHVSEYADPSGVVRNTRPGGLRQLMMDGDLAAIMGERIVAPQGVRTVISDAKTAAQMWVRKSGIMPVNHILAMKTGLLAENPWLIRELYELFETARRAAVADGAEPPTEYGLGANRRSLQLLLDFCFDQNVLSRGYNVDEMFVDAVNGPEGLCTGAQAAAP
jgi:4,5-dihydroxyphthalate decarboxylase